jgi:hypothetical protein
VKTFTFSLLAALLAGTVASVWFSVTRFDGLVAATEAHAMAKRPDGAVVPPPARPPFRGTAGGQAAILSIDPWPPRAMTELSFTLELPGYAGKEAPRISLEMAGMAMGRNEVLPVRSPDGKWRGTGTVVACRSGRRDWTARVVVPGAGEASFPFELAR